MNQKRIGIFLIILSILLAGLFYQVQRELEVLVQQRVDSQQTCFLENGTCLHQKVSNIYLFGEAFALLLFSLGLYLIFFDKSAKILALHAEQNVQIAAALQKAEEEKTKDVGFTAFLAGFNEDQQKVLKAIKEQDGILQSTLRYRTGLTKTDVSLILKNFEEKGYISKKPDGNTNKVFLRKVF